MTDAHALFPPSSAARWGNQCPASAALEAQFANLVDEESAKSAAEGHAAHWVGTEGLAGRSAAIGETAPNGTIIDDEMLEAAQVWIDDIRARFETFGWPEHIDHIEERATANDDNWGTPDWWTFIPDDGLGGLLLIDDFKYGHRFVDAFENWQMINYALAVSNHVDFIGRRHDKIKVVMTVVQPRNYSPLGPVRRWETTLTELHPFWAQLTQAIEEGSGDQAETKVGPECRDCKARHACPALQLAADNAADVAESAVALELPPDALGSELRMLKRAQALLDARVTGLETQALAEMRAGKSVPFFQIERSVGREIWTKPVEEVRVIGEVMGINVLKPAQLITPAQARKAGLDEALVKSFSDRPGGAFKIAPADTKEARKVFGRDG